MFDLKTQFLSLILSLPALLTALTVHEFAHGFVADKMGDPTARYSGRLSLNPMDHMDLWGTICLLFFHFGWAKPVPINPRNFRNSKWGTVAVSVAGPFANFLLALVCAFAYVGIMTLDPNKITVFFGYIFYYGVQLNVGLMVFNLIPIPPLDGSKILMEFLPPKYRFKMYSMERYFSLILLALIAFNVLTPVLSLFRGWVLALINLIVGLVF